MKASGFGTHVEVRSRPGFWRRLRRKKLGMVSLAVIGLIVLGAIFAPLVAPDQPDTADFLHVLANPSWHHLLGTDELGRDVFSRLLYGARPTLLYGLEAVGVTFAISLPVGLVAGFYGGRVDRVLMQINDAGLSLPVMVVVLLVLSVFQNAFWLSMVAFGVLISPPTVRNIRGPVLAIRNELFMDAAQVAGLSRMQVIRRHVLPRVQGPIFVQATLVSSGAVMFTVGLGFLGFGIHPPNPSWGSMTAESAQELIQSPWLLIASGGITGIFVLSLGLLGDAVRDASVEVWAAAPTRSRATAGQRSRVAATRGDPTGQPATPSTDPPDKSALLSIRNLTIAFERGGRPVNVASDVSFDIAPGETVGLVGESGCGKTSVARAILRLLRGGGHVVDGQILFEGEDVLALNARDLARFRGASVGYVSQEPLVALDPSFRVGSLLREAVRSHSDISRAEANRRVLELLELVRLPEPARVAKLYPHELSGGMAQRVSIARALAGNPKLLIADEPTTALDVTIQAEILALLRSLQHQTGMAVMLVSHDWGVVAQLCNRAIVMYAGEVVEQAPLSDLLQRPAHPYTVALLACRPGSVSDDAIELVTIPGTVPAPEDWSLSCRFADRCSCCVEDCRAAPIAIEELGPDRLSRCIRSQDVLSQELAGAAH